MLPTRSSIVIYGLSIRRQSRSGLKAEGCLPILAYRLNGARLPQATRHTDHRLEAAQMLHIQGI